MRRRTDRRKWWQKLIRGICIGIPVVLVVGIAGVMIYPKVAASVTVTYDEYTATTGTISNSLSFSGSVSAILNTTYTASYASDVRTVYAAAGDKVAEGDKLVRLTNGTTVTADFAGTVNKVYAEEGDSVAAGANLIQVVDLENMEVSLRIDEYDISNVSVGDACTVTITSLNQSFTGEITFIDHVSSSTGSVAYYAATAEVAVTDGVLPGMQCSVSIVREEAQNVVILKEDALSFDATNAAFVYQMDETGSMQQVPVEIGVSNGNYVEIVAGLTDGDVVYVEAEEDTSAASGLASLFTSINGEQRTDRSNFPSDGSEFPGFTGGEMPSGERPSMGGAAQ